MFQRKKPLGIPVAICEAYTELNAGAGSHDMGKQTKGEARKRGLKTAE